jgi:chromosome segregation ATPase
MKQNRIFRALLTALLLTVVIAQSCKEPDIKLVNKVKGFAPRWATLGEKMTYLDRNLTQAEKRFEKDFDELEGMLGVIADSLKGRKYRIMLKDYDSLTVKRDTIRAIYTANKAEYKSEADDFNAWEKQVMAAEIETEAGLSRLKEYKAVQKRLEHQADSLTTELETLYSQHNTILRDLARMMEIYTNYDIRMQ